MEMGDQFSDHFKFKNKLKTVKTTMLIYAISDNNPGIEEVNWINSSKNVTVDRPFMMFRICP